MNCECLQRLAYRAIFHIQYAGSIILFFTYFAGARKIVFHYHGTKYPNNKIHKLIWKYLEDKISIVANTRHTKNTILTKFNVSSQINVIPNFIDLEKFQYSERNHSTNKFIITYAGRFAIGKNTDIILETAKILNENDSNIEFLLVGDGGEREKLKHLIEEYSLSESVRLLPFTDEIVSVYNESHLFLFLSSFESFGNVVVEAALTGLPVLCLRIPALEELIRDDYFFVNELNPEIIANKILKLKDNYGTTMSKLNDVCKYLTEHLDNQKNLENLENIYKQLCRT